MPAFGDSYRKNTPYQQKNIHSQHHQLHFPQQSQNPQNSVSPTNTTRSFSPTTIASGNFGKPVASQLSTIPGVGSGGVGGSFKHRIFPKEPTSHQAFKSTQTAAPSPLLSALPNPVDLFSRPFLSASPGTNSTGQNSVAEGSPPSSWPASHTNHGSLPRGIGGSFPPQRSNGAYPSFEEHLGRNTSFGHQRFGTVHGVLGAPGINGDVSRLTPGEGGYACSFDTLDGELENVVCLGSQGGIDIWRMGKGSLDLIGKVEGLPGAVRSAKILPTPQRDDPLASIRPLIALTIQSSVRTSSENDSHSPPPSSPEVSRPHSAASFSSSRSHHSHYSNSASRLTEDSEWQTSVEIYSLLTRERVAILLTSPPEPCLNNGSGELSPPPVWAGLRVEVGDKSIAVGLGVSGEVYLFNLISVIHTNQAVAVPQILSESLPKKGKKGRAQRRSLPPPTISLPSTEIRGEWVCQGKIWTTVQIPTTGGFSAEGGSGALNHGPGNVGLGFFQNGSPVFSLQGRWLAYLPPPANSSISAGGVVGVSHGPAAASVMTQTPPPQPNITAQVDNSDSEEKLINRMARGATQEVIRGAKWVGEHGMKAWQNYWNGGGQNGQNIGPGALPSSANGGPGNFTGVGGSGLGSVPGVSALGQQLQRERQMQQMSNYAASVGSPYNGGSGYPGHNSNTPPPAATPTNTSQLQSGGYVKSAMHGPNDPMLVSLLDIERFPTSADEAQILSNSGHSPLAPFATFQPTYGASFISLAPGGLALLTVSGKGDVYSVWDLMRVVHKPGVSITGTASTISTNGTASVTANKHVRQIALFTRMTVARTIDVVWSSPRGERFAVLTDRGTVHFHDLPYNAYQWPPFKKSPRSSSSTGSSPVFNAQQAAGVVQAVQGAVSLLGSSTQPLLTAARRRRPSNTSAAAKIPSPPRGIFMKYSNTRGRETTADAGGSSGGSKGSNGRTGVDKVSLPGNLSVISPGLVKFLVGKERGKVSLMGGGVLHIYQKSTGSSVGSKKRRSMVTGGVILESGVAYDLPGLPDNGSTARTGQGEEDQLIELDKVVDGYWNGKSQHHHASLGRLSDIPYRKKDDYQQYIHHPLSFAEIETNPAYPPFHTDRRTTLMIFTDNNSMNMTTDGAALLQNAQISTPRLYDTMKEDLQTDKGAKWVFGLPIKTEKLNLGGGRGDVEFIEGGALEDVADAMESKMRLSVRLAPADGSEEKVVLKPRRRKRGKNGNGVGDHEGFFEEDCVLDFVAGV